LDSKLNRKCFNIFSEAFRDNNTPNNGGLEMLRKGTAIFCAVALTLTIWTLVQNDDSVKGASTGTVMEQTIWDHDYPFMGEKAVDGVAIGEIYTDKTGSESVVVSRDGGVYVVYYENDQWIKEKVWDSPGQQLTPAIGDLRPDKTGNEILVVGLSSGTEYEDPGDGTATVLYREGSTWMTERAYTDEKLIHGCAIGDLDPTHAGVEAVVTTFNYTALMVWWDNDHWNSSLIFEDSHNVRKAVIADLTDEHEGNEVVAVSKSGNCTVAWGTAGDWTWERVYQGQPLARVAVGNVDPDAGLEIYMGLDVPTGGVIGIKWDGDDWIERAVFTDTDKNRGVWTGDVDPEVPGNELYSFGYSRRLVQISGSFAGGWNYKDLFLDTARGHEIRVGDLRPDIPGNEIAIVGYSNNMTLVYPSEWVYDQPFIGTDPIDGLAIGEVYSDKPGFETVITSRDGGVYLVYLDTDQWITEEIWRSPGQQLTPAIGDIRPDKTGNEILVVGLSSGDEDNNPGDGIATVLYREGSSWNNERAYTDSKLLHGCAVGDLDASRPGVEMVYTTFDYTAVVGWWDGTEYKSEFLYKDSHNVRKAVIADLLESHPGNEVVCISKSGNATIVYGEIGDWTVETIYDKTPVARVAVGNVDPDPGLEIYLGCDVPTGDVIGLKWDGSEWVDTVVFQDTDKNRGVWTGDVDPDIPGQELYAYGYSRKLTRISDPFGTGKNVKTLFTDVARGHEIRVGDIIPGKAGNEIGIVGYSNNFTIVHLKDQGEPVVPTLTGEGTITVASGETGTADLEVVGDSYMNLEISTLDGVDVSVYPSTVFIKGDVKVEVVADHTNQEVTGDITITLHHPGGTVTKTISVTVTPDSSAPSGTGASENDGAEIQLSDTVEITLSESVTEDSFDSAVTAGDIKVMVGEEIQDVVFSLSDDGKKVTVTMNDQMKTGTAVITVGGLKDLAGNTMETYTLSLEVKGEDSEDDDPDSTWLIILVIVVILIIAAVLIGYFVMVKKKDDEEDAPELPKE
jgi:hypothetical protein